MKYIERGALKNEKILSGIIMGIFLIGVDSKTHLTRRCSRRHWPWRSIIARTILWAKRQIIIAESVGDGSAELNRTKESYNV